MTKLLRGRFDCKVDAKGRLSLPSALRTQLPASSSTKPVNLVITNSLFKNRKCLDVYPEDEWKKLEKRIAALPSLKVEVQAYQRFYLSAGQPIELDGHHRMLVPQTLRKFAGIEEDIVVIGMGSKFEIWPASIWLSLQEELSQQFDDIQAAVAALEEAE